MSKKRNPESGILTITGITPKLKQAVINLASEDCMDSSTFVRHVLKKEVDKRSIEDYNHRR